MSGRSSGRAFRPSGDLRASPCAGSLTGICIASSIRIFRSRAFRSPAGGAHPVAGGLCSSFVNDGFIRDYPRCRHRRPRRQAGQDNAPALPGHPGAAVAPRPCSGLDAVAKLVEPACPVSDAPAAAVETDDFFVTECLIGRDLGQPVPFAPMTDKTDGQSWLKRNQ